MKREIKDLLHFCLRPSILISLFLILIQIFGSESNSLYGFDLKNNPWIHQNFQHLINNLIFWLPLTFSNENKIGHIRMMFFIIFSFCFIEVLFRIFPFSNFSSSTDLAVGMSALVSAQMALMLYLRRNLKVFLFTLILMSGLLIPYFTPDPISRLGHAFGFLSGLSLSPIVLKRLHR